MTILRIEHKVPSYDGWKKAFDSDPINRKGAGVRRYRIFRQSDDPNNVIIDLEFDDKNNAEAALESLHKVWREVEGKIMVKPHAYILDVVEAVEI